MKIKGMFSCTALGGYYCGDGQSWGDESRGTEARMVYSHLELIYGGFQVAEHYSNPALRRLGLGLQLELTGSYCSTSPVEGGKHSQAKQ